MFVCDCTFVLMTTTRSNEAVNYFCTSKLIFIFSIFLYPLFYHIKCVILKYNIDFILFVFL